MDDLAECAEKSAAPQKQKNRNTERTKEQYLLGYPGILIFLELLPGSCGRFSSF